MVKRITRPLTMLALAASLGLGALAAQAQPAPGDMPPPPHAMHRGHDFDGFAMQGRLLKEAGVTDAQRAQLKQIFEAARNDLKGQRETGRQLHERMEALFTAPTVDANAVEQLRQQIAAQHEVASKRLTLAMIDASRVLTPEQRAKIAELKKQQREKMKQRMKDRGRHRKDRQGANPDNPVPQPFTER